MPPIPLIKPFDPERMVGTSGVWSVVETTQAARTGADGNGTDHQGRGGAASGGLHSAWLLLGVGAAAAAAILFALRAHSGRRPFDTVER